MQQHPQTTQPEGSAPTSATPSVHEQLKSMLEEQRQSFIKEETTVLPPARYLRTAVPRDASSSSDRRRNDRPATGGSGRTAAASIRQAHLPSLGAPPLPPTEEVISWDVAATTAGAYHHSTSVSRPSRPYSAGVYTSSVAQQHDTRSRGGACDEGQLVIVSPRPPTAPPGAESARRPTRAAGDPLDTTVPTTASRVMGGAITSEISNAQVRGVSTSPEKRRYCIDAPLHVQQEQSALFQTLTRAVELVDTYRNLRVGISDEERLALGQFVTSIGGAAAASQLAEISGAPDAMKCLAPAASVSDPKPERNLQFDSPRVSAQSAEASHAAPLSDAELATLIDLASGQNFGTVEAVERIAQRVSGNAVIHMSTWVVDEANSGDELARKDSVVSHNNVSHPIYLKSSTCVDSDIISLLNLASDDDHRRGDYSFVAGQRLVYVHHRSQDELIENIAESKVLEPLNKSRATVVVIFDFAETVTAAASGTLQTIAMSASRGAAAQIRANKRLHRQASANRLNQLGKSFSTTVCRGETGLIELLLCELHAALRNRQVLLYMPRYSRDALLSESQMADRAAVCYYLRRDCLMPRASSPSSSPSTPSESGVTNSKYVLERKVLSEKEVPTAVAARLCSNQLHHSAESVEHDLKASSIASVADENGSVLAVVEIAEPLLPLESSMPFSPQLVRWVAEVLDFFSHHFLGARQLTRNDEESAGTATLLECLSLLLHEDIADGKTARRAIVECFLRLLRGSSRIVDCVALYSVNPGARLFEVVYQFEPHIMPSVADQSTSKSETASTSGITFESIVTTSNSDDQCAMDGIAHNAVVSKRPVVTNASCDGPLSLETSQVPLPDFVIKTDGLPYELGNVPMSSISSIISIPLLSHGECIAVVQLYNPKTVLGSTATLSRFLSSDVLQLERMAHHVAPWLRGVLTYEFAVQAGNAAMSLARCHSRRPRPSRSFSSGSTSTHGAPSNLPMASSTRKSARSAALGMLFVDALHMAGTIKVLAVPEDVLETVTLPTFNIWALRDGYPNARDIVTKLTLVLFEKTGLPEHLKINQDKLVNFIVFIRDKYRDVPYHNFFHAFDVFQTIYHFLYDGGHVSKRLSKLTQFVLLVTSLCHDVDHMGLNNSFHLKSDSPLGILSSATGTQSVLEVHHCNLSVGILSQPESDIFAQLPREDEAAAYRLLLDGILGTDMAKHGDSVQQLKQMQAKATAQSSAEGDDDSMNLSCGSADDQLAKDLERERLIAMTLLKVADISNVTKPFEVSLRWGQAVIEEFSKQGDTEKVTGLAVQPLFDREQNRNLAKTQLGFIQFVAEPYFSLVVGTILPELQYCVDGMRANTAEWKARSDGGQ
jgi:hypothetical protein